MIFGTLLALFVMDTRRGHSFFKSVFLIPMMIAPTVAGLLWRFMLNNEFGVINTALNTIGLQSVPWLVDLRMVLACVVVVDSWTCIPFVFLLMFTALTSVPQDMLEAGKIDGGNAWQVFFRIQLPTIRSALMVTLVLRFMDVFRIYDSIYLMTKGGPGNATEALSLYIYRVNWNKYMMGKASAMSYIMMIIMTIIGLVIQFYSKDKYDRREDKKMKNMSKEAAM
jgi:multiple sugar transport system permease protein